MDKLKVLIMAGGKGSRLGGDLPKVLQKVGGVPIIDRVLKAVSGIDPKPLVVVGHEGELVANHLGERAWLVWQDKPLGTGHAVASAQSVIKELGVTELLVVAADHPFVSTTVLNGLLATHRAHGGPVTITSLLLPDFAGDNSRFAGFGRVVRSSTGAVDSIVEVKDASESERAITDVNVAYYCFNTGWLFEALANITDNNQSGEYYLTDVVALAKQAGLSVQAHIITHIPSAVGVNTPAELASAEQLAQELADQY